jgi:hypothetical protein
MDETYLLPPTLHVRTLVLDLGGRTWGLTLIPAELTPHLTSLKVTSEHDYDWRRAFVGDDLDSEYGDDGVTELRVRARWAKLERLVLCAPEPRQTSNVKWTAEETVANVIQPLMAVRNRPDEADSPPLMTHLKLIGTTSRIILPSLLDTTIRDTMPAWSSMLELRLPVLMSRDLWMRLPKACPRLHSLVIDAAQHLRGFQELDEQDKKELVVTDDILRHIASSWPDMTCFAWCSPYTNAYGELHTWETTGTGWQSLAAWTQLCQFELMMVDVDEDEDPSYDFTRKCGWTHEAVTVCLAVWPALTVFRVEDEGVDVTPTLLTAFNRLAPQLQTICLVGWTPTLTSDDLIAFAHAHPALRVMSILQLQPETITDAVLQAFAHSCPMLHTSPVPPTTTFREDTMVQMLCHNRKLTRLVMQVDRLRDATWAAATATKPSALEHLELTVTQSVAISDVGLAAIRSACPLLRYLDLDLVAHDDAKTVTNTITLRGIQHLLASCRHLQHLSLPTLPLSEPVDVADVYNLVRYLPEQSNGWFAELAFRSFTPLSCPELIHQLTVRNVLRYRLGRIHLTLGQQAPVEREE